MRNAFLKTAVGFIVILLLVFVFSAFFGGTSFQKACHLRVFFGSAPDLHFGDLILLTLFLVGLCTLTITIQWRKGGFSVNRFDGAEMILHVPSGMIKLRNPVSLLMSRGVLHPKYYRDLYAV